MLRNLLVVLCALVCLPAVAQEQKTVFKKLSLELQKLTEAKAGPDSIDVSLSVTKGFQRNAAFRILSAPSPGSFYVVRLPLSSVTKLVQNEHVVFVNRVIIPKEEINTGASDPTLNLITYAHHLFPQVLGRTVVVSVKERRFDTADIDLKGRVLFTGLENETNTSHASLMATIIAGAGNSSPFAKGAAPAAVVSSSSFSNLFPDPDSIYRRYGISLQNHSYGTAVENFYGNEAAAYDANAANNPQLLHVFSAGNSGATTNASGPFAGVTNMANLSGNFKQAKNIITVSAVDSMGQLLPLSSKGPAFDGRVKPELVAYGEDGSSGAAALSSGAAILVQDLYSQLHSGNLPSSALVKVVLLNSADDVGEKHVDYLSGYGLLNAYEALQTIKENRVGEGTASQNGETTFHLTVPPNAAQIKLTLAWTDRPAMPNAAKALVNDLDLVLQSPTGERRTPWVLNINPVLDSLRLPAHRGIDTLNNVEQITVDNPAAGTYTVVVKATRLESAEQPFAFAYQVDTANGFYWTYPTATDALVAGRTHTLRWHTNISGAGSVEYTTNGFDWLPVGNVADLSQGHIKWTLPTISSLAQVRLVMANRRLVSDTFTISPQQRLQTGFNCADSFLLYWNVLPVNEYRLYQLGSQYLELTTMLPDTAVIFAKAQHPSLFYSVAPIINGHEGIRSNALDYTAQAVGCYLRSFYLQFQTEAGATFTATLGTAYNVSTVSLEKFSAGQYAAIQTITNPQTTDFTFADAPLQQGENLFRLKIKLANGAIVYSDPETVYATGTAGPVLFYPNPVSQGGSLKVYVQEVGRYILEFYDATGRKVYRQELNTSVSLIPANRLSKGLYFIRILDSEGKPRTVKQIIF